MMRAAGARPRARIRRRSGRRVQRRLVSGCAVALFAVLAACGRYGSVERLPRATAPAAEAPGEAPGDEGDEEDDDR